MNAFTREGHSGLRADWEALERVFISPDAASRATLLKYMQQILFGLHDFLNTNVGITEAIDLKALSEQYSDTRLPDNPEKKLSDIITDLIDQVAPRAVNVASPYFVGHMTSAIPFFMVHLKTIVAALNQNVIKLETSKVVSIIERQVLAKVHRLMFRREEGFYDKNVQAPDATLGLFTGGGTSANLFALWVARNAAFPRKPGFAGIEADGMPAAFRAHGVAHAHVLVSRRGHYSLAKAGGVLGLGNRNVTPLPVDQHHRIDLAALEQALETLSASPKDRIIAVVGIAGATETGTVDPLPQMADLCRRHGVHFHVDAAWGGPVMASRRHRDLLEGIERADSITIDGHKQFYMPMGCGMVLFRHPHIADVVAYHANYVNREGSVDLGIRALAGSREASSLILDSALKIMGKNGYALLIDHGIRLAKDFAAEIRRRPDFELTSEPELNILTYRYCPHGWRNLPADTAIIEDRLDDLNIRLQRDQREAGRSFVSRTKLPLPGKMDREAVVLRAVLMNPMTTLSILEKILDEQERIGARLAKEILPA
jgi:glutamate decarboxylase